MNQQNEMKPIDAKRRTMIWKWFLDPGANPVPPGLKKEELLSVYANSMILIREFGQTLNRLGIMYASLTKQKFTNGKVR